MNKKDLLTRQDICKMSGLSMETIKAYRARGECNFPPEDMMLGRTPVWYRSTILNWRPALRETA